MHPGHFARLLRSKPFQLVGSRSFSLCLVHEPLVVALAFAMGGKPSLRLLLLAAIPLIVLVTEGFYRLVKRPSHRLARMAAGGRRTHAARRAKEETSPSEVAAVEQV